MRPLRHLRPVVTDWKKWGLGGSIEFGPEPMLRIWLGPWRWGVKYAYPDRKPPS